MMAAPCRRARWLTLLLAFAFALVVAPYTWITPEPVSADTNLVIGEDARVSYTSGDSIRVRSEPSYSGSVITSVPEGWLVAVLDGPIDDGDGSQWYQVTARGQTGYMVSDYLSYPGSSSRDSADSSANAEVGVAAAATTTVALNLRSAASLSASVLLVMPRGASVETTGSTQNGFTQLVYQGTTGWAASQFLTTGGSDPPGEVIGTAWVIDGALNLRSGPSTSNSVLLVMPGGSEVGVTGSPQNGFTPVRYNGTNGWAYSQFLTDDEPGSDPDPDPGPVIDTAWVIDGALNLRSGPSMSNSVLLVMPGGSEVGVTGSPQNGYTPIRYNGTDGWAYSQFLSDTEPGTDPDPDPGPVIDTMYTTAALNLRSGPSTSNGVLRVIPDGAEVGITGSQQSGFFPVRYDGTDGYASATYLSADAPGTDPDPEPTPPGGIVGTRYATASLNLRSGAGLGFAVLTVIPQGAEVGITGSEQNGFFPVRYNGVAGFSSASFLSTTPPASGPDPDPDPDPGGDGTISWPISGGQWEITQGYNGSSHINTSSTYQYHYSLDLARVDRNTAGQTVISPVDGTVRWTERSSGGITIDMGNGYAVALFHVTVDRGWLPGDTINKGDFIGTISGPGGEGFVGFAHLHFTVWATTDGGNWSRQAVPFSGQNAISGNNFPDVGGGQQWTGTFFNP